MLNKREFDNKKRDAYSQKVRKEDLSRDYRARKIDEFERTQKANSQMYDSMITGQQDVSQKLKQCYVTETKQKNFNTKEKNY